MVDNGDIMKKLNNVLVEDMKMPSNTKSQMSSSEVIKEKYHFRLEW